MLHRRAVGRVPLRQEAPVPLLRLPRAGRVRAQHRAGPARRLRGGALRRRRRAAVAPRRRAQRHAGAHRARLTALRPPAPPRASETALFPTITLCPLQIHCGTNGTDRTA